MEPVTFHPKNGADQDVVNSKNVTLPSLEIPLGTVGRIPKSLSLKIFIKTVAVTYVVATAIGILYLIFIS